MGLRSEAAARAIANDRQRAIAESATPFDNWAGKEDAYIEYLIQCPSYKWVDGELKTIRGFESIDKHFYDYLENKDMSCYHRAIGRGYRNWMVTVKERYLELRAQGKLKDVDVAEAERKEREYWIQYYNEHPQFNRPKGY
jgi:hypothetical protein